MKKIFKGFTLVELIVVMAIISILMLGIMQMFKPIRTLYVDSTLNETQRTAQNGIIQYVTESVRYATDLGIYTKGGSIGSASAAVDAFAEQYLFDNGIYSANCTETTPGASGLTIQADADYATKLAKTKNKIRACAEVIIIDNTKINYNGTDCSGRILRRKVTPPAKGTTVTSGSVPSDPTYASGKSALTSTDDWRIALGTAYYGENTYNISLTLPTNTYNRSYSIGGATKNVKTIKTPQPTDTFPNETGMLFINVASTNNGKRDLSTKDTKTNIEAITTNGGVLCRNLRAGGMYHLDNFTSSTTAASSVTYIVFINDEIKITTSDKLE